MLEQENTFIQKYLNSIFLSLGKPVEINFKNGDLAYGIFGGFDHYTKTLLVRNFCSQDSETSEKSKHICFDSMRFFTIKEPPINSHIEPKNNSITKVLKSKSEKVETSEFLFKTASVTERPKGIKNDTFRTDVEISKKTSEFRAPHKKGPEGSGKVFKKFQSDFILKGELLESENSDNFDQFKANQLHFGIHSHFNENDYTTTLDLKSLNSEQVQRADRLANEILGSGLNDIKESRHLLEERGLLELKDNDDEEALYSAVVRVDEVLVTPKPARIEVRETTVKPVTAKPKFLLKEISNPVKEVFRLTVAKNFARSKVERKDTLEPESVFLKQLVPVSSPTQQFYQRPPQPMYIDPNMYINPNMYMNLGYMQSQVQYYPGNVNPYGMMGQGYQDPRFYQK